MNRLAAATVLAVLAASGAGAAQAAAAPPPTLIRLVSVTTSYSTVDVPPKSTSVGDRQMFKSRLLNAGRQFGKPAGAAVGSDSGTLRVTSPTSARVTAVAKLPGGTVTVSGPLQAAGAGAVSVKVVSGTGVYAGARGSLTILAPSGPKTAVNVYRLSYAPVA